MLNRKQNLAQTFRNLYLCIIICHLVLLDTIKFAESTDEASKAESQQHIDKGNALLGAGQLNDALNHYNSAIDLDPENYQGRYRRATCLLALGRSKQAVPDLDATIKLKPSFWQAKEQRAGVFFKQGKFDLATKDNDDCKAHSQNSRNMIQEIKTAKQHFSNAEIYMKRGHYDYALKSIDKIKEKCPWSVDIKRLQADCYEYFGETDKTITSLRPLVQLSPSTAPETYLRLSKLHYQKAELDLSLAQIRECLKIDPDHKTCMPFYKTAKKMKKSLDTSKRLINEENYTDAMKKIHNIKTMAEEKTAELQTEPSLEFQSFLKFQECLIHDRANNLIMAIDRCTHAKDDLKSLKFSENSDTEQQLIRIYEKLLKILEDNEEFDLAGELYREINQSQIPIDNLEEKMEKFEKKKKRAKSRDYYKILNVKRNARAKEIRNQYKKMALIYHPDRCGQNEDTTGWSDKKCENAFRDIADAKEVLTDKEKRAMFDEGTDPLDASEQAEQNRGHGHPFQGGFNPFGGGGPFGGHGGGGRKFHFNF